MFSLLSMYIYLLVFIIWFIFFISFCIVFWFQHIYILVHINCEHRIEIYFMQHILYIVLCTKKKSFPFLFSKSWYLPSLDFWVEPGLRWRPGWYRLDYEPFISRTWDHENPPLFLHTRGDQGRRASDSLVIQYPLASFRRAKWAWSLTPLGNRIPNRVIPCCI